MLLAVHRVCVNSFTWKRNPFTRTFCEIHSLKHRLKKCCCFFSKVYVHITLCCGMHLLNYTPNDLTPAYAYSRLGEPFL